MSHGGIIVGVIFLMLMHRFRPYPMSFVRTFAWTEFYFVVTLTTDPLTGDNYGFLLHKPEAFSILSYLSDWRPLYLLQMHGVALLFFCVALFPFAIVDLVRRIRFFRKAVPKSSLKVMRRSKTCLLHSHHRENETSSRRRRYHRRKTPGLHSRAVRD